MGTRRLLFIGADGMDPVITDRLMAAGELPNFSRLRNSGGYSRLPTVNPPQSPVVWASIATGLDPGGHGIFDFIHRDPATYRPTLSLVRQEKGKFLNPVGPSTFWERIAAKGIPATVIKWPVAFPPRACDANVLAGLGVPDIKGNLGLYCLFTTDLSQSGDGKKGQVLHLEQRGEQFLGKIPGPWTASLTARKEATVPLDIRRTGTGLVCQAGKVTFTLNPGEWSEWVELTFDAGFFRTINGNVRFLLQSCGPQINLYMTPVNAPYDSAEMRISNPPGYAAALKNALGPFATLGLAEDTNALGDGILSEDEFLQFCDDLVNERERMLFHELGRFREGLLACVFDTLDRIQHMFWRFTDPGHPGYSPETAAAYRHVIDDAYRRMDGIIGRVVREMPPDTKLIVCSDHGFSPFRRAVNLNTWLQHAGYLSLKPGINRVEGLFEGVDWNKTKAYSVGFNSIYLNLKGREAEGIVTAADVPALKQEITAGLTALSDRAKQVVRTVHDGASIFSGACSQAAPDLVAGFSPGYRASWQSAIGAITTEEIVEDNLNKWSGDHCCDAAAVDGVLFSSVPLAASPHVLSLAGLFESLVG